MQPSNAKVAIYCRVSTLHQVDKDSLPMQRKDLTAYAQLILHTTDYTIFEDAGYSGKNTERPEFQRMMRMIRAGAFTHLLVWKIDRISRNLLDFATMYAELKKLGVTFVSRNEQFDTSTAMGEAMLKIILVFAELERNMTSERVTATMISRANAGKWNGGRIPFGYDYDFETMQFSINDQEAELVRRIHDDYERKKSLLIVARQLNHEGYTTRAGGLWNPVSLRIILVNKFYVGDYVYNRLKGGTGNRADQKDESEWVTIPDHHSAIISRDQKERIITLLHQNNRFDVQRRKSNVHGTVHIFAGLLFCGNCGEMFLAHSSTPRKAGYRYSNYSCPMKRKSTDVCNSRGTSDPVVGDVVINYILNMLNAQKRISTITSTQQLERILLRGDTFSYIDHIAPAGLEDLFSVLQSGEISEDVYGAKLKLTPSSAKTSEITKLRREIDKIRKSLDRLRNLYLIDETMSEKNFILEKQKYTDKMSSLQAQLDALSDDHSVPGVSDEEFLEKASQFILSQQLANRNYISFNRLLLELDHSVLRNFFLSVIDRITITNGKVSNITFRNGLSHSFILKESEMTK